MSEDIIAKIVQAARILNQASVPVHDRWLRVSQSSLRQLLRVPPTIGNRIAREKCPNRRKK